MIKIETQDAMDILKRLRISLATANVDGKRVLEPLSIAIEALKKQKPEKAHKTPYHRCDKGTALRYACPTCGRIFWEKYHIANYCDSCGQKLETGEKE